MSARSLLVTGGAGFIGSAVCRKLVSAGHPVVNFDALTYSGNPESLRDIASSPLYSFCLGDISDADLVLDSLRKHEVGAIMHLAAESHVDRSIDAPAIFLETNVLGTMSLLDAALAYWRELPAARAAAFRFHHVSTDEVFGDLPLGADGFDEQAPYAPSSPYAASKAAADHLVRAWHRTYGLPILISNCSNNFGPYQYPEKLIPLMIINAIQGRPLPLYGDGSNLRDWLFVDDHVAGLERVLRHGEPGETYLIGGRCERSNLAVAESICGILDMKRPLANGSLRRGLISFVADRPGHDRRYAVDCTKMEVRLGWSPSTPFEEGLAATIDWYLDNDWWWRPILARQDARTP